MKDSTIKGRHVGPFKELITEQRPWRPLTYLVWDEFVSKGSFQYGRPEGRETNTV